MKYTRDELLALRDVAHSTITLSKNVQLIAQRTNVVTAVAVRSKFRSAADPSGRAAAASTGLDVLRATPTTAAGGRGADVGPSSSSGGGKPAGIGAGLREHLTQVRAEFHAAAAAGDAPPFDVVGGGPSTSVETPPFSLEAPPPTSEAVKPPLAPATAPKAAWRIDVPFQLVHDAAQQAAGQAKQPSSRPGSGDSKKPLMSRSGVLLSPSLNTLIPTGRRGAPVIPMIVPTAAMRIVASTTSGGHLMTSSSSASAGINPHARPWTPPVAAATPEEDPAAEASS